jgi:hypothetical protein
VEFWDLDKLVRDENQDNLYDMFAPTFMDKGNYQFEEHIVTRDEEMRIDLVCFNIYGDVDQVPFLMNFNKITNPLNIKENDIIRWCNKDVLQEFRQSPEAEAVIQKISGVNKSTRKDPNRQKFVENDFALPPNLLETPQSSINVVGDRLIIGS